jgi:heptosyltransferase I
VLLHMHASMRANRVSLLVRAGRRVGFDRGRARDFQRLFTNERIAAHPRQHVMDGLFGFAEHLGVARRGLRWDIPVAPADEAFAADLCAGDAPVVVISPCSSERQRNYRNWPAERYAEVARQLAARYGARIVVTGAGTAEERRYGEAIHEALPSGATGLVGRSSLKQLFAVIRRARLVICPDSGPAHMATAAGTPVVGLYATSDPRRTGPYLSAALTVNRYPDAVRRAFGREPDALRFGRRVRDPDAMSLITVEDVLGKAAQVLGGGAPFTTG